MMKISPPSITAEFDMTGLNRVVDRFIREVGFSGWEVIRDQGGMLMGELVTATGPRNLGKAKNGAERDVKRTFYRVPQRMFEGQKRRGDDAIWMYSGPVFLVGTLQQHWKPSASINQMADLHYKATPDAKWRMVGTRGIQEVWIVDKPVVGRASYQAFIRKVTERFGRAKAAWAVGARTIKPNLRIPAWVRKHVDNGKAPGAFINGLFNRSSPNLTLISRAKGVESPKSKQMIRSVLKRRIARASKDLSLYLKGVKNKAGVK